MLEIRKCALIIALALVLSACTSMLLGTSGSGAGGTQASGQSLQARVYDQLRDSTEFSQVQVIAHGSQITLRGLVANATLRERAQIIASSTAGVSSVRNLLVLATN